MKKSPHKPPAKESIWSPFQNPLFKMLWIASVISNTGTWMHDVTAAWLMATLTENPMLVALVQSVTAFSLSLLALPAGALADIMERRTYLIVLQTFMMIIAGVLAFMTYFGDMSPELLLFLTFLLGAGSALNAPTWFALMSELVSPKELPAAVTLTGLTINFARAIGPTLAGIIIAAASSAAVFALNALSFFAIILSLYGWKRPESESILPTERLVGAMRAGIRYVRNSPALLVIFVKSSAFFLFASGVWALLPLIARESLSSGALGYGILYGCLGIGAIFGALLLPKARELVNCDPLIVLGAIGFSITTLILSFTSNLYVACGAMALGGLSWICVISTLMIVVQQAVPTWVRARAVSIFLAIFFGGMAVGSLLWGWVASHMTLSLALLTAAIGLVIINFLAYLLTSSEELITDFTPSEFAGLPILAETPNFDQGPVMITVEYTVDPEHVADFLRVMKRVRRIRLREGAFFWGLFKDTEHTSTYVECFMTDTWVEHLRQHERESVSDREILHKAGSFHHGKARPRVTHFIAQDIPKE